MKYSKFSYFFLLILLCPVFSITSAVSIQQTKKTDQVPIPLQIRDRSGNEIDIYSGSYALLIGVSNYTKGWAILREVPKDIEEIDKILSKQGFITRKLIDGTRQKIEDTIEEFISLYGHTSDNRLLFYYAGHGWTVFPEYGGQGMGYIVPVDAPNPRYESAGFVRKSIDMSKFISWAKQIDSKHAIFLFDSCFSGALFSRNRSDLTDFISSKTTKPVRQFITSGDANEKVPDKSFFKKYFLEGIEGSADSDSDGYVTGTELGFYIEKNVVNYSNDFQHPQVGKINDEFLDKGDFVFYTGNVIKPVIPDKAPPKASEIEVDFWKTCKELNTIAAYEDYISKFQKGLYIEQARQKINSLGVGKTPPPLSVKLLQISNATVLSYKKQLQSILIPKEVLIKKVSGQLSLIISVDSSGKIKIDSITEVEMKIKPESLRSAILASILSHLNSILIAPPIDRSGNRVMLVGWRMSYSISQKNDNILLERIEI